MARRSFSKQLNVWMNGELVGLWQIGRNNRHEFEYAESWFSSEFARPLSLSMPLRPDRLGYGGEVVSFFFENLLPDSLDIRRRIQTQFRTATDSAFDLLFETGRDCAGAIQLLPVGEAPDGFKQIQSRALSEPEVAAAIRNATGDGSPGESADEPFSISIAGAQEKTALLLHNGAWHRPEGATPTTHIFKLPLGMIGNMQANLSTSVENEWLCSKIIKQFGIPVANCDIGQFEDQRVLIVERFDRIKAEDDSYWIRRPQEDMCQALGFPPALKYEADGGPGIKEVSKLLLGSRKAQEDRKIFMRAQIVFWLLCAPDGHAKNFSIFLESGGRFSMTPLYDVISAFPILGNKINEISRRKVRLAMAARGKNKHYHWAEIQPRHWVSTAKMNGLEHMVEDELEFIRDSTATAIENVQKMLPDNFPTNVSNGVFEGMQSVAEMIGKNN